MATQPSLSDGITCLSVDLRGDGRGLAQHAGREHSIETGPTAVALISAHTRAITSPLRTSSRSAASATTIGADQTRFLPRGESDRRGVSRRPHIFYALRGGTCRYCVIDGSVN
jgi:hypothetical protein